MPQIYNLIESQIDTLARLFLEDDEGMIAYNSLLPGPKYIRIAIMVISTIIFLLLLFNGGIFLWNQGLAAALPKVVSPIGNIDKIGQLENPFAQLMVTIIAMMMIL